MADASPLRLDEVLRLALAPTEPAGLKLAAASKRLAEGALGLGSAARLGDAIRRLTQTPPFTDALTSVTRHTNWIEQLQKQVAQARRALMVCARVGWVGIGDDLSLTSVIDMAQTFRRDGVKAFDRQVTRAYRKDGHRRVNRLVRRWWKLPVMKRRKSQALAAIRAHKQGEYLLSVPVLFALVDCVCVEILKPKKRPKGTWHVREAAMKVAQGQSLAWAVHNIYYADYNNPRPRSTLNRHAVVHGYTYNYGTEVNSLKVITLLDALVRAAL